MIASINEQTEFYKNHSHEEVLKEIEENKDKISVAYTLFLNEMAPGRYVYTLTFDNKEIFQMIVVDYEGDFRLTQFVLQNH